MIDWDGSYGAKFRLVEIDESTWLPTGETHAIESLTVKRSAGSSLLVESADMTVTGSLEPGWYRVQMEAVQGGSGELVDIATMRFEPDGSEWLFGAWSGSVTGTSVLSPADVEDDTLPDGAYAPAGADAGKIVKRLLSERIHAPIAVEGERRIAEPIVYDLDSTRLEAAWQVLNAIGWCLQIAGDGTVTVRRIPDETEHMVGNAAVVSSVSVDSDGNYTYERQWRPGINPYTAVRLKIPRAGTDVTRNVTEQTVQCGNGAMVSETIGSIE